jgi:hypothetical protein
VKRITLGAALVAIGAVILGAPTPAAATRSCDPVAVGDYYKFSNVHATHVSCALARRLAKHSAHDQRQSGGTRHYVYDWRAFRCSGRSNGAYVDTKLRWHCLRDQGR